MSGIGFYAVKHAGIIYANVLYFIVAASLSGILGNLDKRATRVFTNMSPSLHALLLIVIISLVGYYSRKIVKRIPFPLNGMYGFDYYKTKEIQGGVVIAFSIFSMQDALSHTIREKTFLRFLKHKPPPPKEATDKAA